MSKKSCVLKMLAESASDDRKISSFPKPFKLNCSPYHKFDFSEKTKNICSSNQLITSSFKISKMIVLGDVSVGKTCIINRFCRQLFDSNYKATIGVDFEVERFDILNVPFNLQIWDTAGQERFKCIAQSYYRAAHVICIVFDLTNLYSLSHCKSWLNEALNACSDIEPFIFLVGNKKDLLSEASYSNVEGYAIKEARNLNAEFWATSAKTSENVKEFFFRSAALTFDDTITKSIETKIPKPIGTDIVSLKQKSRSGRAAKCPCH